MQDQDNAAATAGVGRRLPLDRWFNMAMAIAIATIIIVCTLDHQLLGA
jgi:hypothetical protein